MFLIPFLAVGETADEVWLDRFEITVKTTFI